MLREYLILLREMFKIKYLIFYPKKLVDRVGNKLNQNSRRKEIIKIKSESIKLKTKTREIFL